MTGSKILEYEVQAPGRISLFFFPKQELLGFSIHTTTGRWTR